ncbi:MAG: nucleotide exchange factor GrpE [Alphaproteobacteria bacterium]
MIEEKDEAATVGRARAAANDQEGRADGAAASELPDEGVPAAADDRLAAIEAELAETKDRLLRALAETENVRRRLQRERDDAQKYAAGSFAKDLLSPVDNLRRALDAVPETETTDPRTRSLRDGVAATEREFLAAFERHGLKRIDPKGERFDHNFHEAVFEAERPDVPSGTVVEVLQPGYVLHDRLLRPAMVGVAKGGAKAGGDAAG